MDQEIFKKFSDSARQVLTQAQRISKDIRSSLNSEHLLLALCLVPGTLAYEILHDSENMVNVDQIRLILSLRGSESNLASGISGPAKEILEEAYKIVLEFNHSQIDAEHILLGITINPHSLAFQILLRLGINPKNIRQQILGVFEGISAIEKINQKFGWGSFPPTTISIGRISPLPPAPARTAAPPPKLPALSFFSQNLTFKASQGQLDPVIGRQPEIQRVIQILARKTKNNPVLIGDPGVGKTAIVEGLATKIARRQAPLTLAGKQIFALDLALIVAGTTYRGQFEARLKKVLSEAQKNPQVILFLDELHTLVGTGSAEGSMDAANILKPALAKGEIRLIGATTIDEYRRQIEKDAALERRLQPILVPEPNVSQTIKILQGLKATYEKHHQVKISRSALTAAAQLSQRYITDRFLPDKAIDLIDEAAAGLQIQKLTDKTSSAKISRLTEKQIAQVVANWTGVPVGALMESEKIKLKNLEQDLQKAVKGQKTALKIISQTIRKSKAGLQNPLRPLGSFIFLGPTGVGKSHLAKTLAQKIYGRDEALIKIDMSEYSERHSVSRLIGAPPGYVGYEESGQLTEAVRRQPYSVILLDEIEKAHPEIFNLLLQVLEDGQLTDSKGRTVNFRNTLIIMTSNIGVEKMNRQAQIGFNAPGEPDQLPSWKNVKQDILESLNETLKPEFLNRVDQVIVFEPLSRTAIGEIVALETQQIIDRLFSQGIYLQTTPEARHFLANQGYNPKLGARPLRRAIAQHLEDPLTIKILDNQIKKGQRLSVSASKDKLLFKTYAAKRVAQKV